MGGEDATAGLLAERVRTAPLVRLAFRALRELYGLGLGRLLGHRSHIGVAGAAGCTAPCAK